MGKKLLVGLAPLLVTAAFVVMPTVAQATPHYYVNGTIVPQEKLFPSLSWGTLTLSSSNTAIAPLSCENAVIGDYENPAGGGAGIGETDNFATTDCVDPECPETSGVELRVGSKELPWAGNLVESGTETLLETKAAVVLIGCYVAHTETLAAAATTCKGNSNPKLKNGKNNLSQEASKIIFTGQGDKLECLSGETKTEGITSKSLSTMLYGAIPSEAKGVAPETSNTQQQTLETFNK